MSKDDLRGRLEWLRNPERCSCPCLLPETHDAVLDERGCIICELLKYEDDTKMAMRPKDREFTLSHFLRSS